MYRGSMLFDDLIDGGHSYSDMMGAGFHVCSGRGLYWQHVLVPIMVSTDGALNGRTNRWRTSVIIRDGEVKVFGVKVGSLIDITDSFSIVSGVCNEVCVGLGVHKGGG